MRDCYDHSVQLMDLVESHRELTASLMELYHSSVGLRTNEIMHAIPAFRLYVGGLPLGGTLRNAAGNGGGFELEEVSHPEACVEKTVQSLTMQVAFLRGVSWAAEARTEETDSTLVLMRLLDRLWRDRPEPRCQLLQVGVVLTRFCEHTNHTPSLFQRMFLPENSL